MPFLSTVRKLSSNSAIDTPTVCAIAPCAIRAEKRHAHEQSLHLTVFLHCGCPEHPGSRRIPRSCRRGRLARRRTRNGTYAPIFHVLQNFYSISMRPRSSGIFVPSGRPPRSRPRGRRPCSAGSPPPGRPAPAPRPRRARRRGTRRSRPREAPGPARRSRAGRAGVTSTRCASRMSATARLGSSTPEMCTSPVSAGKIVRLAGQVMVERVVHQAEHALAADRRDRRRRLRLQPQRAGLEAERLDEPGQPARCEDRRAGPPAPGAAGPAGCRRWSGTSTSASRAAGLRIVGERRRLGRPRRRASRRTAAAR